MQTHTGPMFSAVQQQTPSASANSRSVSSFSSSGHFPDEWFRDEFERLYAQVADFVDIFFCQFKDITLESNLFPWTEMSSEFVRYSTIVAEPDDSLGDWNRMLITRNERWYLLVGILARILEAKVFGELLFGGSRGQKRQLEDLERSSVELEGFGRTESRANNVDAILGDCPTPDFDIDVTRLSKQIMVLFQPLRRFLEAAAEYEQGPSPKDEDAFRSIHGIVSMAAHLSILIRLSPTIFYFHSERPGNLYDPDDQTDMDYAAYVASKSAATKAQGRQRSETKRYRALVRFAVWPSIKRYSAGIGHWEHETNDFREHETNGFRVYNISNSRVVYYWGLADCEHRVSISLQTFIEQQRRERRSRVVNVANDTVRIVGAMARRAMDRVGGYRVAVVLAASAYLVARDYMQGRDSFGWQQGQRGIFSGRI